MKDPLQYTYDGIERELNLLEIHLKEAPRGDEAFCKDCIDKHISTVRGFALEGVGFTKDKNEINNFLETEKQLREIKGQDYKTKGVELAQKVRNIRKKLYEECPDCVVTHFSPTKKSTKSLNSSKPFSNQQLNLNNLNQMKNKSYIDLMYMNAGQFAAEGVRYLVETQKPDWDKYVSIGGGIALQALGLFFKKLPAAVKTISLVAGSNLLAGGVIKLVKGTEPVARVGTVKVSSNNKVGVSGYAGKSYSYAPVYGGKTFAGKVTASNIPSQYARAGILSGAQAFEAPEHADLIRVD